MVLEGKCRGWLDAVAAMGALYQRRGIWPARGAAGCAVAWVARGGIPRIKEERAVMQWEQAGALWVERYYFIWWEEACKPLDGI